MGMEKKDYELFQQLRKQVADYITEYLKNDYGHKSYEGTWELTCSYPDYFQDTTANAKPCFCQITLYCYVIGPGRKHEWKGESWSEALKKCKKDINKWTSEN